ncbi:MAG TPA: recombination regulator RecX [Chondromyces sp.]|nr:recombination regulator RecX [Chondromyces sp.]
MPVITKISTQQKNQDRYNIFLDDAYAFSVDEEVLIRFNLKKGMILDQDTLAKIQGEDVVRKAINSAVHFLARRMRSEKEVTDYLTKKEYAPEAIKRAIPHLYKLHYLDDRQFAEAYTKTQIHTTDKGPKLIEIELREKGVKEEWIVQALEAFTQEDQLEKAAVLASKACRKYRKESPIAQRQKTEQVLIRKGYPREIVRKALDLAEAGGEEEQLEALMYQAEKAHRRYKGYSGGEYRQKMKQFLYRKGFPIEQIEKAIEKLLDEE